MITPFQKVRKAMKDLEPKLPPNYGIAFITWNQETSEIETDSNLPSNVVAALLTAWLKRLPPPVEVHDFDFDSKH